jgi:TRAP-type C4-dicarboxylate transport system substrate-binding protein
MKRTVKSVILASTMALMAGGAIAKDIQLKMSQWMPSTYFLVTDVMVPWAEEIGKVTEGRVTVQILPKVVGSAAGQSDVVIDGLADIVNLIPGYTPDRFPSVAFGELPLLQGDGTKVAATFEALFREHIEPLGEFKGMKVLTISPMTPLQLETKGNVIDEVSDIEGLKLRSSGKTLTETLDAIGAIPVAKSAAEAYEMLSSGTLDGQVTIPTVVTGFNQTDLHDHTLLLPGGLGNAVSVIAMNQRKWDMISPEDQAAIMSISGAAFGQKALDAYIEQDIQALEIMRDAGYTITTGSPEMIDELLELVKPIEQAWVERATAAGFTNAADVLEEYKMLNAAE